MAKIGFLLHVHALKHAENTEHQLIKMMSDQLKDGPGREVIAETFHRRTDTVERIVAAEERRVNPKKIRQ